MQSYPTLYIVAGLFFCLQTQAASTKPAPAVIPRPVKLEIKDGEYELNAKTVIAAGQQAKPEARHLAKALRAATGFDMRVQAAAPRANCIRLELDPALASRLGSEGYRLVVAPDLVSIRASASAGLFYGCVTFLQLLPPQIFSASKVEAAPGATPKPIRWAVPCVEIEDYPRFKWRGLLLDVARHYMPVEGLKRFIDLAANHKFNSLQLHLTDDQGWRIQIKKYPRLTTVGSIRKESPKRGARNEGDGAPYGPFFYTQAQIRDLVSYAQARHVTLVPEIEMPGHFRSALAAYPQFSCTGGPFEVRTRWGVEDDILCAGNDAAIAFAQDILSEVLELFPSQFIHIGGDEAPRTRWQRCPKCQARIKAELLKNEAELQSYLNSRIDALLSSRGRRLVGWDEILEGGLAPGATVMSWRGVEGGIAAANAGHDVVMSPTTHCYFDYAQAEGPDEPECIGGFIALETVYSYEPVPTDVDATRRHHILGAQGNVWTEFIHTIPEAEYFAFPRAIALSEVVWTPPEKKNYTDFLGRLKTHLKRLNALGVNYRPLNGPSNSSK